MHIHGVTLLSLHLFSSNLWKYWTLSPYKRPGRCCLWGPLGMLTVKLNVGVKDRAATWQTHTMLVGGRNARGKRPHPDYVKSCMWMERSLLTGHDHKNDHKVVWFCFVLSFVNVLLRQIWAPQDSRNLASAEPGLLRWGWGWGEEFWHEVLASLCLWHSFISTEKVGQLGHNLVITSFRDFSVPLNLDDMTNMKKEGVEKRCLSRQLN